MPGERRTDSDPEDLRALSFSQRAAKLVGCAAAATHAFGEAERVANLLLDREPALARADLHTALVCGDVATVRARLEAAPELARSVAGPGTPRPPLCWVAFSRLGRRAPAIAEGLLALAELLLQRGADVNAGFTGDETWGSELRPLFGACGAVGFPEMAALLLDHGAMIEDGESLYHSLEHGDTRCLEFLLERGADAARTNVLAHAFDVPGTLRARLLLDHGADPNARMHDGTPMLHRAIAMNRGLDVVELLLERGADPRTLDPAGRSTVELARLHGAVDVADRLVASGVEDRSSDVARFVTACVAGNLELAREIAAKSGIAKAPSISAAHAFLAHAERRDPAIAEAMIDAGFPVDTTNALGQSALHWAAWHGRAALVKRLLAAGAEVDRREAQFGGTPLGWAVHGNHAAPRDGGQHAEVVRVLLAAGASPDVRNRWSEPMVDEDDDSEVAAILRAAAQESG